MRLIAFTVCSKQPFIISSKYVDSEIIRVKDEVKRYSKGKSDWNTDATVERHAARNVFLMTSKPRREQEKIEGNWEAQESNGQKKQAKRLGIARGIKTKFCINSQSKK